MRILNLQRMCIVLLKDIKFKLKGFMEFRIRRKTKNMIKATSITEVEKKQLLYLNTYGFRYNEYIEEYLSCELKCDNKVNIVSDKNIPIVICIVKNDLMRIKLFIQYYRNLGVQQFVFLDDHSTDGTKEYLLKQDDIVVFSTCKGYTTIRRQVWINKLVVQIGYNRWYLIVDSDELFDYADSKKRPIGDFVSELIKKGSRCSKAILLDMFSEKSLFADGVKNESDIIEECKMFYPNYRFTKNAFDISIKGGAREAMFSQIKVETSPVVSKYPLIYMDSDTIAINSHHNLPAISNQPVYADSVLKHYKFLPDDRKKYASRIKKGNFHNNSKEYCDYFEVEKSGKYEDIVKNMVVYEDFSSLYQLNVMNGDIL